MAKKTVADFREMKKRGEPIAWTTCYDFSMAQLAERAGLQHLGDDGGATNLRIVATLIYTSYIE